MSKYVWRIDVWPRHSYLTEAFTPTKSDLDLSIYVRNESSLSSYLTYYSWFKKLVPFLGEINIYYPLSLEYINKNDVNGFELERDPILISKFKLNIYKPENFTYEKAISYLLMALVNDIHKLERNSKLRVKKWKYHFKHLQSSLKHYDSKAPKIELNEQSIIFSILTAISILSRCGTLEASFILRSKLRIYLAFATKNKTEHYNQLMSPLLTQDDSLLTTYFIEYVCFLAVENSILNQQQLQIMCAQMDWVMLRLLKQNYNQIVNSDSLEELIQFKRVLNSFKEKFFDEISLLKINSTLSKIDQCKKILETNAQISQPVLARNLVNET